MDEAGVVITQPLEAADPVERGTKEISLIEPFPESVLNEQAGKMLLENYEEYACLASLYTGIHAHKQKNKSKNGAIYESTTALNMGQGNSTVPSKNIPSGPAQVSTSTSTKVLGIQDQNAAPSGPSVGSSAKHRKDGPLAVKIPAEKKKMEARKKSLKRLLLVFDLRPNGL
ncbi:ubiquitin-conjugating enzyme E2 22-like [Hordeum vulgare subsp. vulgare]|uniref:ubiquitin-conjugating enzyme E2 22-like n=1 Tax=Hordeum vulgare subsp. vulgare TaxID=112509 RepID=UPI001D1A392B|nr:ubiquitin-conjugating enzyme E2 22-like [Hordeum vulgare subsp. vulgare]